MDTPVRSIIHSSVPCQQHLTSTFHHTESQGAEEEHGQLPPHENVPQGCRSSQEGRCPRLNYSLRDIVHWSFGFLFDTIFRETSGPHLADWGRLFCIKGYGSWLLLYVQYTTMWDLESFFIKISDYALISPSVNLVSCSSRFMRH
jgi:hypothetical protein